MKKNRAVWGGLLLLGSLWGNSLWADIDSFSVLAFRPAPGRGPYLYLSDTQVKETLDFNVGMLLDYARTPFKTTVGAATQSINKRFLTDHLLFDINATPFLQFGFEFPVVFYNQFYNPSNGYARENQFDLGDPLIMVKGEILDPAEKPIGLAIVPYTTLPLGNGETFTGTNEISPGVKLAVEKKWKKASLAANFGYLFQNNVTRAGVNIDDMFTYGLGAAVQLPKGFSLVGEFDGRTVGKDFLERESQSPAQFTALLRKNFNSGLSVEAGAGAGLARGVGAPLARGFVALSCNQNCFGGHGPDQDGDGVADSKDECPTTAGPKSNKGCPKSDIKVGVDQIQTPNIYFEFGKARLTKEGKEVVNRLAEAIKAHPAIKGLRIEGHTDSIGGRATNLRLSKERAAAVKKQLESSGVTIYLESEGYGFEKPLASNKTLDGRAQNRRVEFLIIEK